MIVSMTELASLMLVVTRTRSAVPIGLSQIGHLGRVTMIVKADVMRRWFLKRPASERNHLYDLSVFETLMMMVHPFDL